MNNKIIKTSHGELIFKPSDTPQEFHARNSKLLEKEFNSQKFSESYDIYVEQAFIAARWFK